ncbi:MAG: hypothetical protein HQK67_06940 [Desulfamplus sp.]|nr:hypothetical protein [Desulfamplus sp.]
MPALDEAAQKKLPALDEAAQKNSPALMEEKQAVTAEPVPAVPAEAPSTDPASN